MKKTLYPLILAAVALTCVAQSGFVSHVTPLNGAFSTDFVLINPTAEALSFRLQPFSADGVQGADVTGVLDPEEHRAYTTQALFGGEISHFLAPDESPLQILVAYRGSDQANSSAHLGLQTHTAPRWRITPGELDDVLDGIAVVNMGDAATEIWVRQVAADGSEFSRLSILQLDPNAKGLNLFQDFTKVPGAWFEVFSNQALAVTALRFSNGNDRFFWESAAIPLPALETDTADPRVGRIAVFPENTTYGVSGRAVISDERTITLENFNYNGSGPDVRVYLGKNGDYANGIPISDNINGTAIVNGTISYQLPDGVTLDDFDGISIWCTLFLIDFSSAQFQ